jgi:hypothetical protein
VQHRPVRRRDVARILMIEDDRKAVDLDTKDFIDTVVPDRPVLIPRFSQSGVWSPTPQLLFDNSRREPQRGH